MRRRRTGCSRSACRTMVVDSIRPACRLDTASALAAWPSGPGRSAAGCGSRPPRAQGPRSRYPSPGLAMWRRPKMEKPLRILLVDDHEVVRAGVRMLLEHRPNMKIVGEASTAAAAIAEAARTTPDVVIMDVRLPDGSGVEACREIRSARPATRVLMLTSFADEEAVDASVMAGASGYLLKQTRSAELIHAIEVVAAGESLLDPTVTHQLLTRFRRLGGSGGAIIDALTEQERRVLALVGDGKTNREIAAALHLSEKTVKNYVSALLGKLHVQRRAAAAALAARQKLS